MDEYALFTVERLIQQFESRIELMKHRGYSYMAKGALLSHLEGAPKALVDLYKILRWAKKRFYFSEQEFRLIHTMLEWLRTQERQQLGGELPVLPTPNEVSTAPRHIRGRVAPWQEWPTKKLQTKREEKRW